MDPDKRSARSESSSTGFSRAGRVSGDSEIMNFLMSPLCPVRFKIASFLHSGVVG
jgi:hypothetical protein